MLFQRGYLQVTGGIFRNRRILSNQGVRPTSSKVREAVFSMLGQDLTGCLFWILSVVRYYGSGGFHRIVFSWRITERSGKTVRQIRQSCQDLSNV